MIVDACLFAGEHEMLALRLRTLAPIVDRFVVVACTLTHQAEPADRALIDAAFQAAVRQAHVDPHVGLHWFEPSLLLQREGRLTMKRPAGERGPALTPWFQHIERQHRNAVADCVRCNLADVPPEASVPDPDEVIVAVSDVDEIPHPMAVAKAEATLSGVRPQLDRLVLAQRFHSGALNLLHPMQPWWGTCVSHLEGMNAQQHRNDRSTIGTPGQNVIVVERGGWHFSWFGTDAERQRKLDTFSHAELRGRYDPTHGRQAGVHSDGQPLHRIDRADAARALDWPVPLTDGTFVPPSWWWA